MKKTQTKASSQKAIKRIEAAANEVCKRCDEITAHAADPTKLLSECFTLARAVGFNEACGQFLTAIAESESNEDIITARPTLKHMKSHVMQANLLVGPHHMFLHAFERRPRGDNVRIGLAFGNCRQELTTGLIESDCPREGKTLTEQFRWICGMCGDLIASLAHLICRGFDPLDGFLTARFCPGLLHDFLSPFCGAHYITTAYVTSKKSPHENR